MTKTRWQGDLAHNLIDYISTIKKDRVLLQFRAKNMWRAYQRLRSLINSWNFNTKRQNVILKKYVQLYCRGNNLSALKILFAALLRSPIHKDDFIALMDDNPLWALATEENTDFAESLLPVLIREATKLHNSQMLCFRKSEINTNNLYPKTILDALKDELAQGNSQTVYALAYLKMTMDKQYLPKFIKLFYEHQDHNGLWYRYLGQYSQNIILFRYREANLSNAALFTILGVSRLLNIPYHFVQHALTAPVCTKDNVTEAPLAHLLLSYEENPLALERLLRTISDFDPTSAQVYQFLTACNNCGETFVHVSSSLLSIVQSEKSVVDKFKTVLRFAHRHLDNKQYKNWYEFSKPSSEFSQTSFGLHIQDKQHVAGVKKLLAKMSPRSLKSTSQSHRECIELPRYKLTN